MIRRNKFQLDSILSLRKSVRIPVGQFSSDKLVWHEQKLLERVTQALRPAALGQPALPQVPYLFRDALSHCQFNLHPVLIAGPPRRRYISSAV